VTPGKVEIGQGILTALVQMVAEELDIRRVAHPPGTGEHGAEPDEGITSGSRSIQDSGLALRHAAAEARDLLLARAAQRLGVTAGEPDCRRRCRVGTQRRISNLLGLATPELLEREASFDAAAKLPAEHIVVGTSLARVDIPGKVTGQAVIRAGYATAGHAARAHQPAAGTAGTTRGAGCERSRGDAGRGRGRA